MRFLLAHTDHFGVKLKKVKIAIFLCGIYDPNDPISTQINDKRMQNSKSAQQVIPGSTNSRKMTYLCITSSKVIDLGWSWKDHNVNVNHRCHLATPIHVQLFISPTKIPKFASFRRWNGTERKFRLTCPWKSGHRSTRVLGTDYGLKIFRRWDVPNRKCKIV